MFVKIFAQILDSTLADSWQVRHVFEDLLKLADKTGVVDMTTSAIARRTGVPLEIVEHAIQQLSQPDPQSRSAAEDGRRIVLLDEHRSWGWRIVNYLQYRAIRDEDARKEYQADWVKQKRASRQIVDKSVDLNRQSTKSTHAEAEAEAEAEAVKEASPTAPPSIPRRRAARIPEDFAVTEEHRQFAANKGLPSPDIEIDRFLDYWRAKPGKGGIKLDWDGTFRNWLRNARTFSRQTQQSTPTPAPPGVSSLSASF